MDEPYRLFTSRSEFRLLLRQDNAVRRLGPLARDLGLLTDTQGDALADRLEREDRVRRWFVDTSLGPASVEPVLVAAGTSTIVQPVRAVELLRRPEVAAAPLLAAGDAPFDPDDAATAGALAAVEVELKYEGYVARERERAEALRAHDAFALADDLPYAEMETLSLEAREKLERIRPASLAQAGRIPGVSPADLQNLLFEVRRRRATRPRGHGT